MSDKIVVDHPRFKGEYDFDIEDEPLTNLEWRWIKKISGYLPLTLYEGWEGRDPDLFIAFAVVALYRAGRVEERDAMSAAASFDALASGGIVIVGQPAPDDAEVDDDKTPPGPADPPAPVPQPRSIGPSSRPISEARDDDPRTIGVPG